MKEPQPSLDLYLIRHEISEMNLYPHIVCGRSDDTPLIPEGERRASLIGGGLRALNVWPDLAETSPALRARQTGNCALRAMGYRGELLINPDLQELDQGDWQGRERKKTYGNPLFMARIAIKRRGFRPPNGESMDDVLARGWNFLHTKEDIMAKPDGLPQTELAFTHGQFTRILVGDILSWSTKKVLDSRQTPNGSLTLLRLRGDEWSVPFVGKSPGELLSASWKP